jgi:hypothetical protein
VRAFEATKLCMNFDLFPKMSHHNAKLLNFSFVVHTFA